MAYPHHLSDEEKEALGGRTRIRPLTLEERRNGKWGRYVEEVIDLPVMVSGYHPNDPFYWADKNGDRWTFGQWANSEWFKEPFVSF